MTYEVTPAPSTTVLHHEICSESLIQWLMRGYCQDQTCTRARSGMQATSQDKERATEGLRLIKFEIYHQQSVGRKGRSVTQNEH